MPQISERWVVQVGRNKHIISGEELKVLLSAGANRFVRFRDLVINPAFVADMVLIDRINNNQIEAPSPTLTDEQRKKNIQWIKNLKKSIPVGVLTKKDKGNKIGNI